MTAPIQVNHINVTYKNGHTALYDSSFNLPAHTIAALIGVNGAGKSTLFKTLMGFIKPQTGQVLLGGQSVKQALRDNRVAYVPQAEEVDWAFPVLVEDVVMMGRYGHMGFLRRAQAADYAAVDEALNRVNMQAFRKRQIGELSGGQKKRVFVARALAQNAPILLLDEPFTGIDVGTEAQIIELLKSLQAEGRTLLVSTHNLSTVTSFCSHAVLVKQTVIAAGLIKEVLTQDNLHKTFGGMQHPWQPQPMAVQA